MCCDCVCVCFAFADILISIPSLCEIVTQNRRVCSQKVWFDCNRKREPDGYNCPHEQPGAEGCSPSETPLLISIRTEWCTFFSRPIRLSEAPKSCCLTCLGPCSYFVSVLFHSCFLSAVALKLWNLQLSAPWKALSSSWCVEGNVLEKEFTILSSILSPPGSHKWPLPSLHNDSAGYNGQLSVRAREDVWQTNIIKTQVRQTYAPLGSAWSWKTGIRMSNMLLSDTDNSPRTCLEVPECSWFLNASVRRLAFGKLYYVFNCSGMQPQRGKHANCNQSFCLL